MITKQAVTSAIFVTEGVLCGMFDADLEVHHCLMLLSGVPEHDAYNYDDTGCGGWVALTAAYRCVDCTRWFHRDCIRVHFTKSADDQ